MFISSLCTLLCIKDEFMNQIVNNIQLAQIWYVCYGHKEHVI